MKFTKFDTSQGFFSHFVPRCAQLYSSLDIPLKPYLAWGTDEFSNLSPQALSSLKYITNLVILDIDDDP